MSASPRRGRPLPATVAAMAVLALSLVVLTFYAARPVAIPVLEYAAEIEPEWTQSLTGVKGQSFVVASDRLSRIDLEVWADVTLTSWIRVKFEIARGVTDRQSLASTIVVFRESRKPWKVNLLLDPSLTRRGEELYLRLEAIVPNPRSRVFYRYDSQDHYLHGQMYDLDQPGVPGQDLYLRQYQAPSTPKPLAWAEAAMVRLQRAAELASVSQRWPVVTLVIVLGIAALAVLVGSVIALVRMLPWTPSFSDYLTAGAAIVALSFLLWLNGELPFGAVRVGLL